MAASPSGRVERAERAFAFVSVHAGVVRACWAVHRSGHSLARASSSIGGCLSCLAGPFYSR